MIEWQKSSAETPFAKIMIKDILMMALIDVGSSVNLISDTLYRQLREPSQIKKNIIAANNGKIHINVSTAIRVQLQKSTSEIEVQFLVTIKDTIACLKVK